MKRSGVVVKKLKVLLAIMLVIANIITMGSGASVLVQATGVDGIEQVVEDEVVEDEVTIEDGTSDEENEVLEDEVLEDEEIISDEEEESDEVAETEESFVYPNGDYTMILNDPNASANEDGAQLTIYNLADELSQYSRSVSVIWYDRTGTYLIRTSSNVVVECYRRYGYYFYGNNGIMYDCRNLTEFAEVMNVSNQTITLSSSASVYSYPFAQSTYVVGAIEEGTYEVTKQAGGLFYISTDSISGWVVAKGNTLDGVSTVLDVSSIDGIPITVKMIPASNTYTRPGTIMKPTYVTIHNTGSNGYGANALAHANLQYNGNSTQASWHFQVDNTSIYQSIPMNEKAYHAGDGMAQGNSSTIAIEICENADGNYSQAEKNAAKLTAAILYEQGLPSDAVKMHRDWSGKNCPQNIIEGTDGTMGWTAFLAMVESEYNELAEADGISVQYQTHRASVGWENWVYNGTLAGAVGESKGVQAMNINIINEEDEGLTGGITYHTYVEGIGWEEEWKTDGNMTGTTGQGLSIEGIEMKLTGTVADNYDVYYQVHVEKLGWLDWVKNGETAGYSEFGYQIEAINIELVKKDEAGPGGTTDSDEDSLIAYSSHVQTIGWQDYVYDGAISGTVGQSYRLEAMKLELVDQEYTGSIEYRTHIQSIGWEDEWSSDGEITGTSGQSLRLEAIQIRLTGDMAEKYDVYYRVHAQSFGWLDWACNGESAGTAGYSYRLESIQVVLVPKGEDPPGDTGTPFVQKMVTYSSHVQNIGWQSYVYDGATSGTSGKSLRLEAMKLALVNQEYSGSIEYKTHIQNVGWEDDWSSDGEMTGTSGRSLRLEAIQIQLTDEMAENYDIYYRVHAQNFGWLDWACNGESAGTAGYSYRLEAIQVELVPKGEDPPGDTGTSFVSK